MLTSIDYAGLVSAYGLLLLALSSPGPNVLAIIGTSMAQGRRQGLAIAMGVSFGSFLWSIIAVSGLAALISVWAGAMTVLRIVGAAYLLWLAYGAFRSAASDSDVALQSREGSGRSLFLKGLGVQMTNPKAALFWIAIAAVGTAGGSVAAILALVVGCTAISVGVHAFYAMAFSTDAVVGVFRRTRRWVQGAMGMLFTYAAFRLATDRT